MSLITCITTRGTRTSRRASTSISTSISKPWARYLSTTDQQHFDVTIVGGGAAGSLMARLLAQKVPSLKVSVLDFRTPKLGKDVLGNGSGSDSGNTSMTEPSARAYALSPSSLDLLGDDIIDRLRQSGRIAFYDSMQVWESDGPATLHFTKEDLDDVNTDTNTNVNANTNANVDIDIDANQNELKGVLGAVIEDEPLVSCIWDELRTKDQVHLISPAAVKRIVAPSTSSKSSPSVNHPPVELTYENENKEEKTITTDLLIAADGANSFVRRLVGKFPTMSMGYGRKAVTCTVALHNNIDKIAFQRFQPNGPIALLPVWDNNNNSHNGNRESKNYANIVWSTTPEEAEELQKLSNEEFIQRMNDLLQSGPTNAPPLFSNEMKEKAPWPLADAANGIEMLSQSINTGLSMSSWTERQRGFVTPPVITEVVGRRFGFDLNLMHAKNYVGPRVCLIGDGKSF
jgi:2-polyprenyl-6-methoxyphenol hydroxylase-like FAD-dependent oxidoreductase